MKRFKYYVHDFGTAVAPLQLKVTVVEVAFVGWNFILVL